MYHVYQVYGVPCLPGVLYSALSYVHIYMHVIFIFRDILYDGTTYKIP